MKRIKHEKKQQNLAAYLFLLPSLLGVCVFLLVPFIDVIRRSFSSGITGEWIGLENYFTVFDNRAFQLATGNTLRFVVVCIPILVLLSLFISVFLNKWLTLGGYIKSGFLVPMAIPVAAVALLWSVIFDESGFLNGVLETFGVEGQDWMNSKYAFWVMVFTYVWKNLGYNIVIWLAGLSEISKSIYESASVDGAGEIKKFFYITLPNILPTFFIVTILSLINSFKVFREAYLVAGSYPDDSMYMLQHLFNNWFRDLSLDKMAAGSVLMAVVLLVIILIFKKLFEEK